MVVVLFLLLSFFLGGGGACAHTHVETSLWQRGRESERMFHLSRREGRGICRAHAAQKELARFDSSRVAVVVRMGEEERSVGGNRGLFI
jgi:hypothetical protein